MHCLHLREYLLFSNILLRYFPVNTSVNSGGKERDGKDSPPCTLLRLVL